MLRGALVIVMTILTSMYLVAQEQGPPFVVGIWGQGDGVIPFADFDGQRWRSSWPASVEADPDLRPLRRVPSAWWGGNRFQPAWDLLEPNGRRRGIRITGTKMLALGSSCAVNVGLETNVPRNTYEYGAVLAADHTGVLDPVQALTPKTADWHAVSALLPGIYQQHEARAWNDVSENWRPDLTAPLTGPTLDHAFASGDESGQYVYFESSRAFTRRPDQRGDQRSLVTGWLWRRSSTSGFQTVAVQAMTIDPDWKGTQSLRPLGVVRHGSRRFWLGSLWSYAYSGLTVLDVRRAGIKPLLVVDYPGC